MVFSACMAVPVPPLTLLDGCRCRRSPAQGLEFFYQDMGFGPQWTHLTKKGACDLGTNMAQAWAASGLQSTR